MKIINKYKWLLILLLGMALLCLYLWTSTSDFRMDQTWEEDAMFYIVGKNFTDFGFWKTRLLDDYAVGSDPLAHPLLYTHFPTISGVLQGLMQTAGIKDIHFIKLLFIPLFLAGMAYYYFVIKRLFTESIALLVLAVSMTDYLAVLNWSDNTVHSLHWLFLYGTLFHYLSIPCTEDLKGRNRLHMLAAWLLFFIAGSLTLIHAMFLVVAIGLFYVFNVHRIRFKYLVIIASAPVVMFAIHQARIISLLGYDAWWFDQLANIKKASNIIDYQKVLDFYTDHGIVIWPSDYKSLTFKQVIGLFLSQLRAKEGLSGIVVLFGLIGVATVQVIVSGRRRIFDVDGFGLKVLILFLASIVWNVIFPTHAVNYFNATPYMLLAGMINLGWAVIFAALISQCLSFKWILSARGYACTLSLIVFLLIFSYQRVDACRMNPIEPIPGHEVLRKYEGAKFYANIWPLYVSYYTKEWAVGGIHPSDAVNLLEIRARLFLQRDKRNHEKYSRPDYYFYTFVEKTAPFTEPKHQAILDRAFRVVECGETWCIYKM